MGNILWINFIYHQLIQIFSLEQLKLSVQSEQEPMGTFRKIISLIIILQIVSCLRVHKTIIPVTFVTPNNKNVSSGTSIIDYKYYDNLQSPSANYYYGSITKDAYDMHIKQYQLQNYQKCFGQLPYSTVDAQSCMKCPQDKPLFNLGTRQCQICKININQKCNKILSQQAALVNTQPSTQNATSSSTSIVNSSLNRSVASSNSTTSLNKSNANITGSTSFSNNTTNVNVPQSTNLSLTGNKITNNQNQGSISRTSPVQKTPTPSNTTSKNPSTPPQKSDSSSYPYVFQWKPKPKIQANASINNNKTPSSSQNGLQYIQAIPLGGNGSNPSTNTNSSSNWSSGNVELPTYTVINSAVNNDSSAVKNQSVLIAGNSQPQVKFQSSQCSLQKPLYNSASKKCEACPLESEYVYPLKKCQNFIYATDPRSKNVILNSSDQIIIKNYDIQNKNPTRTVKYCPLDKPFQINGTCNQCINGSLYNATSQKCQNGCPSGQVYNQITSNCVNGTYITNPSAPTLLSPLKNYQTFKKQQQNLLQSSFIYVRCPLNNPISVNNKCIQCDTSTPYYNIDSKKCENCSRGRYYNGQERNCKGDYNQGLEIYRMVPNIV